MEDLLLLPTDARVPGRRDGHTFVMCDVRPRLRPVTTTDRDTAAALLGALSLDQKVALLAGVDTWHTASFGAPPVPAIRVSDGPAGVRGTSFTGPASASFPCGSALGATWDPALVGEIGRA